MERHHPRIFATLQTRCGCSREMELPSHTSRPPRVWRVPLKPDYSLLDPGNASDPVPMVVREFGLVGYYPLPHEYAIRAVYRETTS